MFNQAKNKLALVLSLMCSLNLAYAQGLKKIFVLDSLTQSPLPYASVLVDDAFQRVSNDSGYFYLPNTQKEIITLKIVYLGYENKILHFPKTDVPKNVFLSPISSLLGEVVVRPFDLEKIVLTATKRLKKGNGMVYPAQSFVRVSSFQNNRYSEFLESFFESQVNCSGVYSWQFEQGRYALAEENKWQPVVASKDFSILLRKMNLLNYPSNENPLPWFPFLNNPNRFFTFSNLGYKKTNDSTGYITIGFSPKTLGSSTFFEGYMILSLPDCGLVFIEAKSFQDKPKLISSESKKAKISSLNISLNIRFASAGNTNSIPLASKIQLNYIYHNQALSWPVNTRLECVNVLYTDSATKIKMGQTKDFGSEDYQNIATNLYNSHIWENNQILAMNQAEKSMVDSFLYKGYFGNAFNNFNDSIRLQKDGYWFWDANKTIKPSQLPTRYSNFNNPFEITLRTKDPINETTDTLLAFSTHIKFLFNCYQNQLSYSCFALFDSTASYFSPKLEENLQAKSIINLCFALTQIYSKELSLSLEKLENACNSRDQILELYKKAQLNLYQEQLQLSQDIWVNERISFWENLIQSRLTNLGYKQK